MSLQLPLEYAAIERILGDPELRERLGTAARSKAQRAWSRRAAAAALCALSDEVS